MNTRSQPGQHFKKDVIYVAMNLTDMRGINKENIVRRKGVEFGDVSILKATCDYPCMALVRFLQKRHEQFWIRLDEDRGNAVIKEKLIGVQCHA